MRQRIQFGVLAALLAVLAWVGFANLGRSPELGVLFANDKLKPLNVVDPALRLDLLERVRKLEYKGTGRNIFSASLPPKPAPPPPPPGPVDTPKPPEPPAFTVPLKFYGYADQPAVPGARRRGFFTDGETVFILAEGDIWQNRIRLLKLGNQSADFEEIPSGRRATVQLEQPPGP